jgi:hypothetical protein
MWPLTWLFQNRIDSSRHSALPAGNNNEKRGQLPYQPIHAHDHALTTSLVHAEVVFFALFVVAGSFLGDRQRDFIAISRRLNSKWWQTILEFFDTGNFR